MSSIQLNRGDLFCLRRGQCLNDNIINYFLNAHIKSIASADQQEQFFIFDTFMMQKMNPSLQQPSIKGRDYSLSIQRANEMREKIIRFVVKNDILSKKILLIPVNSYKHWSLVAIVGPIYQITDQSPRLICFDSASRQCASKYRRLLEQTLKEFLLAMNSSLSISAIERIKLEVATVAKQPNDFDCGLYVLENAEFFLRLALDHGLDCSQIPQKISFKEFHSEIAIKERRKVLRVIVESLVN